MIRKRLDPFQVSAAHRAKADAAAKTSHGPEAAAAILAAALNTVSPARLEPEHPQSLMNLRLCCKPLWEAWLLSWRAASPWAEPAWRSCFGSAFFEAERLNAFVSTDGRPNLLFGAALKRFVRKSCFLIERGATRLLVKYFEIAQRSQCPQLLMYNQFVPAELAQPEMCRLTAAALERDSVQALRAVLAVQLFFFQQPLQWPAELSRFPQRCVQELIRLQHCALKSLSTAESPLLALVPSSFPHRFCPPSCPLHQRAEGPLVVANHQHPFIDASQSLYLLCLALPVQQDGTDFSVAAQPAQGVLLPLTAPLEQNLLWERAASTEQLNLLCELSAVTAVASHEPLLALLARFLVSFCRLPPPVSLSAFKANSLLRALKQRRDIVRHLLSLFFQHASAQRADHAAVALWLAKKAHLSDA